MNQSPTEVFLWLRDEPSADRVAELAETMGQYPRTRGVLAIVTDGTELPGTVIVRAEDPMRFDVSTFRLMVYDIL